jgi:hypothetical protein
MVPISFYSYLYIHDFSVESSTGDYSTLLNMNQIWPLGVYN